LCSDSSEHKKGQFEPAEVGKIAEKHFSIGISENSGSIFY
jgi:hypothetical protein